MENDDIGKRNLIKVKGFSKQFKYPLVKDGNARFTPVTSKACLITNELDIYVFKTIQVPSSQR